MNNDYPDPTFGFVSDIPSMEPVITEYPVTPSPTENIVIPTTSSEPVFVDSSDDPIFVYSEDRSVYDGDISDGILSKLSAYYNAHAPINMPYVIYRPSQYYYRLVYGYTNNYITFNSCTVVEYYSYSSYASNDVTVTVSEYQNFTVDLTGDTGYIYSSSESFIPSRYINSDRINSIGVLAVCILIAFFVMSRFIFDLLGGKK